VHIAQDRRHEGARKTEI